MKTKTLITAVSSFCILHSALAFEGRITAALTRGSQVTPLLYTAGANCLRVEKMAASNRPNPVDLIDLPSGQMTLLFPNNRSFLHLKAAAENASSASPSFPAMPPGRRPQSQFLTAQPPSIGPTNLQGMSEPSALSQMPAMRSMPAVGDMPAMPMMPPMMMGKMELTAMGDKTNLLGLACEKFQIKQRGETMEIWATAHLFPFQPYLQNQPHRFGPEMIEEKWGGLLAEKKLFPLLAILKFDNGVERYRFEVTQILSEKTTDDDAKQFLPPPDYTEIQPLSF